MAEDPHYFYGGYLSNFYTAPFTLRGHKFQTSEQGFMYLKALLMGDEESAAKILKAVIPARAKALGRAISPWNQELWNREKYEIMKEVLTEKFRQNYRLGKLLVATGDVELVEASPADRIWGIGRSVSDAKSGLPWRGENLLGKALMDVRWELAELAMSMDRA